MQTYALYAQPKDMVDPGRVSRELAQIFPEIDPVAMERRLTDGRSFLWIRRVMSPEQMQRVHEIGDPGLLFGPREMRLYPNGPLAAHILGGASFGAEGVDSAEVIGTAGIEKALDARLRDPTAPRRLDLRPPVLLDDLRDLLHQFRPCPQVGSLLCVNEFVQFLNQWIMYSTTKMLIVGIIGTQGITM